MWTAVSTVAVAAVDVAVAEEVAVVGVEEVEEVEGFEVIAKQKCLPGLHQA